MSITIELLRKAFPNAKQDYLVAVVGAQGKLAQYGITTPLRIRHFLAQAAAETGGFTIYEESGNYSAQGLLDTFPKYFKSLAEAKAYARKPQAIFNRTYGGRADLGNTKPGDGYKFRGRGVFQMTGRGSYADFGKRLGLDLINHPELAAIPEHSIKAAILYWDDKGLNAWADRDDLLAVSRGINGGNPKRNIQPNGMEHRRAWYAALKKFDLGWAQADESDLLEDGTLTESDTGPEVKRLQTLLRAKGYAAGAIDGIYGANTRRAVQAFELDVIKPDRAPKGEWEPHYWAELEKAENIHSERAQTTASDLKSDPAVKSLTFAQRLITFLGLGSLLTGSASDGAANFPARVTLYQPVIDMFRPLFQLASNNGWIIVCVICIALWLLARWGIKHIVKAYRYGDYQGAFKGDK